MRAAVFRRGRAVVTRAETTLDWVEPSIHSVPVADPGTRKRGSTMSRLHRLGAVAFLIGLLPGVLRSQAAGTISGRVVAAEGQPIVGAQVSVAGTTRGANTDQQGRYTITGVPA